MPRFADIIVPLALPPLTFSLGEEDVAAGGRVVVEVGRGRFYTGVALRTHDQTPEFATKPVQAVLPGFAVSQEQVGLWSWIADYYMCTLGEVMACAMPSVLRPSGESLAEVLRNQPKLHLSRYISLHPSLGSDESLNRALEKLERFPALYRAMMDIVAYLADNRAEEMPRELSGAPLNVLRTLEKRELIRICERSAIPAGDFPAPDPGELTPHQKEAFASVEQQFMQKDTLLLHGITSSGKSMVYFAAMDKALQEGKSVLYLLPEIALTSQLVRRIERHFPGRVVEYHSHLTPRRRLDAWQAAQSGGHVIVGARSAIFLPFKELGLVVVDEEHDPSYKQADPAPRYHARDTAMVLARLCGAKTLLGSATPSIESYSNALSGKYGLALLTERYGQGALPRIVLSDTLRAAKRGERRGHLNKELSDAIAKALEEGRQVMLFQNRRGFSPYVECPACAHIPFCRSCNMPLTFHAFERKLRCHHCGTSQRMPEACPACGKGKPEPRGFGTEKIAGEIAKKYPQAAVARLDSDATRNKTDYRTILDDFSARRTDILVGTQMIAKGFDFGGVALVGILNADNLLSLPDFRAAERAFSLITQVAGRAGRTDDRGEVVVQTSRPELEIIRQALSGDYPAMFAAQMAERKEFCYPPWCRMIEVELKSRNEDTLSAAAQWLEQRLRPLLGDALMGPAPPPVERIRGEHILRFTLKLGPERKLAQAKQTLREALSALSALHKRVRVAIDVDPQF